MGERALLWALMGEIYYKKLTIKVMEADKFQDAQGKSASLPRKADVSG